MAAVAGAGTFLGFEGGRRSSCQPSVSLSDTRLVMVVV